MAVQALASLVRHFAHPRTLEEFEMLWSWSALFGESHFLRDIAAQQMQEGPGGQSGVAPSLYDTLRDKPCIPRIPIRSPIFLGVKELLSPGFSACRVG